LIEGVLEKLLSLSSLEESNLFRMKVIVACCGSSVVPFLGGSFLISV
jgi:hypothetical protein